MGDGAGRRAGADCVRDGRAARGSLKWRVLAYIKARGPSFRSEIARGLNADVYDVGRALTSLSTYDRSLVVIGTARDAGRAERNTKPTAKIYALPGTPKLARAPDDDDDCAPRSVLHPERVAAPRRIGRGLGGWGGWR